MYQQNERNQIQDAEPKLMLRQLEQMNFMNMS